MTRNDQFLIEIVRLNTYERSIDYLMWHYKTMGLSDKETSRAILRLLLEKLEEKNE